MSSPIVEPKTDNITDFIILGVAKVAEEKITAGFIGNSTYFSGAAKVGAGFALSSMMKGKYSKILAQAFVIDGVEDVITAFMRSRGMGGADAEKGIITL